MHAFIRRLGWQIPVLMLLPSLLIPAWSWHSAWFGPWPLWFAAMPLAAQWLSRRAACPVYRASHRTRAQVLVFPDVARIEAPAKYAAPRAA